MQGLPRGSSRRFGPDAGRIDNPDTTKSKANKMMPDVATPTPAEITSSSDDLLRYIEAGPMPAFVVEETLRRAQACGATLLSEPQPWKTELGSLIAVQRGGSIVLVRLGNRPPWETGFRIIGAHTDSPNLRIKPCPELEKAGVKQWEVEVYGSPLLNSWLDRALGIAGEVMIRDPYENQSASSSFRTVRVRSQEPIAMIPQLAIHLQRGVNRDGLVLNPQQHLHPIWQVRMGTPEAPSRADMDLRALLASWVQADPSDLLAWDLGLFVWESPQRFGSDGDLLAAPRLDNLASCHAGLRAMLSHGHLSSGGGTLAPASPTTPTQVLALFDHEECGSRSHAGAQSGLLRSVLERLMGPGVAYDHAVAHDNTSASKGGSADLWHRAMAHSWFLSADMAHALHPNYSDRHDLNHAPRLGGGPVLKTNANQSYATHAEGVAFFTALCASVGIKPQHFNARNDVGCGSTIGPHTAAGMGIRSIDVGSPMLAMHASREFACARDVDPMIEVMRAFLHS